MDINTCISCGLCISTCPHFYISPPFPTIMQIKSFIEGYGINDRVPILFVDETHVKHVIPIVLNLIEEDKPIILFVIPYIAYASLEILSYLDSSGFPVYIYLDNKEKDYIPMD